MRLLRHPREEAFAQAYVRGETAGRAGASYRAAGYAGKRSSTNAGRLLSRQRVRLRIAELQQEMQAIERQATDRAIVRLAITKEAVLGEMARIAFANMADYVTQDATGKVKVDLSRLTRDQGAAIREVVVEPRAGGHGEGAMTEQRIRVKLAPKDAALMGLARYFGLFVDRTHVTHELVDMSDDQLAEYIRNAATQLTRSGIDVAALVGIRTGAGGSGVADATYDAVPVPALPEAAPVPRSGEDVS